MKKLKPMTMVQPIPGIVEKMKKSAPTWKSCRPITCAVLLFIGYIKNIPEHGVFAEQKTGKLYIGYHAYDFEEIPKNEL